MDLISIVGHQAQNFVITNYFGFANIMKNTTIINTFNSDNSYIITIIAYRILKYEPILTNYYSLLSLLLAGSVTSHISILL